MAPFGRLHTSSYWRYMVTTALSCTIFEIKLKSRYLHLHSTPPLGVSPSDISMRFGVEKNGVSTRRWKSLMMCSAVSIQSGVWRIDKRRDRQAYLAKASSALCIRIAG